LRNIIIALLLLPLLAILQSTLLPYFSWHSKIKLDLVLVIVLSWNLVYPNRESILWALIGGLMMDSLSGSHMGTSVTALVTASLIANLGSSRVWSSHIILRISVAIAGSIIYYLVYFLLLATTGWRTDWTNLPIDNLLRSIPINVLLMMLILPPARWLALRITRQDVDI